MTLTDTEVLLLPPGRPATAGLLEAARRHRTIVLAAVVLALAVATALGIAYKPTYTASTQLNVGRLDVSTQAIPGYAQAIQNLAVSYARLVNATGVVVPVAAQLHMSPGAVRNSVSASPVALSPLITVSATSPSGQ